MSADSSSRNDRVTTGDVHLSISATGSTLTRWSALSKLSSWVDEIGNRLLDYRLAISSVTFAG